MLLYLRPAVSPPPLTSTPRTTARSARGPRQSSQVNAKQLCFWTQYAAVPGILVLVCTYLPNHVLVQGSTTHARYRCTRYVRSIADDLLGYLAGCPTGVCLRFALLLCLRRVPPRWENTQYYYYTINNVNRRFSLIMATSFLLLEK